MGIHPDSAGLDRETRLTLPAVESRVQPPSLRLQSFQEAHLPWTADMVRAEAARCLQCPGRPCVEACPLGTDIPGALHWVERGNLDAGAAVIHESNNLSEVCGRLCPHGKLCEGACPHNKLGMPPVAIGRIETVLAEYWWKKRAPGARRVSMAGSRIAVVGAGPAGLTVAELLAEEGHGVTVFDQWPGGGGSLRYGNPRFKLDHSLVRRRLSALQASGVEFVFDTRISEVGGLEEFFRMRFDAVFLGTGAGTPVPLDLPGSDLPGVLWAVPFLVRANVEQNLRPSAMEDPPRVGPRVVVVGEGDTAVDCCRTALRLGASPVTALCPGGEAGAGVNPQDRMLAREEGTVFLAGVDPLRFLADEQGRVRGIECLRTAPVVGDPGGPALPYPGAASGFLVCADTVILAPALRPDPTFPGENAGVQRDDLGCLVVERSTGRTSRPGVWAGGGNVLGVSPVGHVVAQGRAAARDILAFLARGLSAEEWWKRAASA